MKRLVFSGMLFAGASLALPPGAVAQEAPQLFSANCAGCHGEGLAGGRGPSLFAQSLLAEHSDGELRRIIGTGIEANGMPSFKDVLKEDQIAQIVSYLRNRGGELQNQPVFVPNPDGQILRTRKQTVRIDVVAAGLETPWGEAFLPDGRLLVTERSGHIRIIDHDKLLPDPVKNTPVPWVRQDGGYFDIAVHPNYRKNGWIYLSYSEIAPGYSGPVDDATTIPPTMTRIVRGRLNSRNEWVDQRDIWKANPGFYTAINIHYGSRFLFDGKGHLFFSVGERGDMTNAQKLSTPLGKIHRINDDGSIPADNPFVGCADAVLWSSQSRRLCGRSGDRADVGIRAWAYRRRRNQYHREGA
jgi:cytochrome c553